MMSATAPRAPCKCRLWRAVPIMPNSCHVSVARISDREGHATLCAGGVPGAGHSNPSHDRRAAALPQADQGFLQSHCLHAGSLPRAGGIPARWLPCSAVIFAALFAGCTRPLHWRLESALWSPFKRAYAGACQSSYIAVLLNVSNTALSRCMTHFWKRGTSFVQLL